MLEKSPQNGPPADRVARLQPRASAPVGSLAAAAPVWKRLDVRVEFVGGAGTRTTLEVDTPCAEMGERRASRGGRVFHEPLVLAQRLRSAASALRCHSFEVEDLRCLGRGGVLADETLPEGARVRDPTLSDP